MKKFTHTLLCCLLLLFSTGMYAQKGLQIASVFQKYGCLLYTSDAADE